MSHINPQIRGRDMRISVLSGFLVVCCFSHLVAAQPNTKQPQATGKLPPFALAKRAQEMFPPELASAVQETIYAEVQANLTQENEDGARSAATLFLADRFYSRVKTGKFENAPTITWNGYDANTNVPSFILE